MGDLREEGIKMMGRYKFKILMVLVSVAVMIPTLKAGIAEFDDFLLQQADKAKRASLKAFDPNPMNVTDHLNHHVHLYVVK